MPPHIYVFSQPCINPYCFSAFPDLIYAHLKSLKKSLCHRILDLTLQIVRKKTDENTGKYVLVEFSPKVCVFLFNVNFRKNWFKLIYIFSNQVVYFIFILAIMYFVT